MTLKFVISVLCVLGFSSLAGAARICPNNDFKACDQVLKNTFKKDTGKEFMSVYEDICASNSKFKCVKMTVLGDIAEKMKELRDERKGASLFEVKQPDGSYIYIFEKREAKK